nr:uncharacterized protein LOC129284042 [Lytechinus pictus]
MTSGKNEKLKDEPRPQPDIVWTEMTRALAQVVIGNLMIILGAGSISYYCYLCYVSAGIWVGLTVMATGIIGVIHASRSSYGVEYTYSIMLVIAMTFAVALFGVEVAAYVYDSRDCDKPIFGNQTTTASPTSWSPFPTHYPTHSPWPSSCIMECVYIHAAEGVLSLLEFAGAVVCIYYLFQSKKKAAPPPYEAMMPDPIPYKA